MSVDVSGFVRCSSMSYPNKYSWDNVRNDPNSQRNDIPLGLNNWQQFETTFEPTWQQQQNVSVPPQPLHSQLQQQPSWNNNPAQKTVSLTPQMNYKDDKVSWQNFSQQNQYLQEQLHQQQQQSQHFHNQQQYSNNPNPYPFKGMHLNQTNSYPQNSSQQMNFSSSNVGAPDPWNWGWDESSSSSPAASFSANNNTSLEPGNKWNVNNSVEESLPTYNPVQNYFQQENNLSGNQIHRQDLKYDAPDHCSNEINSQPNTESLNQNLYYDNDEKPLFNRDKNNEILNIKQDLGNECLGDSLTIDNVNEVNFGGDLGSNFNVKAEGSQSFHSNNVSNIKEIKAERLSPDVTKTPLTAQALRDFCKEKFENGAIDSKSRSSTEGLTQQWSIESQISQDTASDDISPFMHEGSHSDMSTWDSTPGHQPTNDSSRESNVSLSPRLSIPNKDLNSSQNLIPDTLNKNFHQRTDDNFIVAERLNVNEQVNKSSLPPPSMSISSPPKSGETSNNPYSLNQKLGNKNSVQGRRVIQKEILSNYSGNEYASMVKQMENCNVTDDILNQQVILNNSQVGIRTTSAQELYNSDTWYQKRGGIGEESINQETIPDNEERPEAEEYKMGEDSTGRYTMKPSTSTSPSQKQSFPTGSDNQEVSCRPDRNQYLETGQLEDQLISNSSNDLSGDPLPPLGLSRLVTGEMQINNSITSQNVPIDISSPPPGLDRMVLGQITENESVPLTDTNSFRRNQNAPPPGLHRMVPGQLTDNQGQRNSESNLNVSNTRHDDIPPPGFHRMVPGESSSPESQNIIPIDTREQRVVTGVAKDEMNVGPIQANISASPTPANRLANQPSNTEENRLQFQSERCETIGSDNVDTYVSNPPDTSSKLVKRKENKERERLREDISSDEFELDSSRRHDRDSDYYSKRERNRERENSSPGERYRDDRERRSKGRERLDWDRERRKESPGRYREDKNRRKDYRDNKRRNKDYDYSDDEDAEGDEYYSDRERRNTSKYKDDYDRLYSRRDERSRNSGKNKRRDGYNERDRDVDRDRDRDRDRIRDRERDKDRDRGRRERDRPREYYRRREDTDEYNQRSRPSSRNDSVQDYKHRPPKSDYDDEREREKDHYRGHSKKDREMFYAPGYNYDQAYYNYYYQYYENLRRTNPAAYAEWFRKFYAHSQPGTFDGTFTEDRGSVHSGRSSANEENKDRSIKAEADFSYGYPSYQSFATDQNYPYHSHSSDTNDHDTGRRLDSSLQMESIQRLTPEKFTTAHVKGRLTCRGQLIKILPHYPLDGQPATLEIYENLGCFEDAKKEFLNFPGPLVKGVTHKNNILKYCKQKIKDADSNPDIFDKESYKLIWELLILLIRQNGTVAGTDIAELLMANRTAHVSRQQSSASHTSLSEIGTQPTLSEEEVTNQFRDYLIYGNSKEALEWAMKHGLWGHALFLASKMDQRTYASVMTRFANGLTMNDPLQTLYQLMSGRQPASVTCCADEKWGDWRPHLAMILSNSTARPDLDVKAVTTLGDTLGVRGNLYAAHFCYLMAQVEFGTFAQKSSKIVLIGSAHTLPFQEFANNEAIFATEIFEFACSLADPEFAMHHFQVYKLLIAKRLTEIGLVQEAVHYVEVIANTIAKFPAHHPPYFIQEVYNLGNMLKFFDPIYNSEGNIDDPEWLLHLLNILNDYHTGVLQHDNVGSASNLTTYSENEGVQNLPLDSMTTDQIGNEMQSWQNQQQIYYDQSQQQNQQQQWYQNDQTASGYQQNNKGFVPMEQPPSAASDNANQPYWNNQNQWMQPQNNHESGFAPQTNENDYLSAVGVETSDSNQNSSHYNFYDPNRNEDPGSQPLQGKVTFSSSRQRTVSRSSDGDKLGQPKSSKPTKKESSKHNQSTGSWFGGIWNRLPFRPKNQMILPDDKNPSIVWDSDKNRWVNLNADEDDSPGSVPPPPKASELASRTIPLAKSASSITTVSNPLPSFSSNPISNAAEHSDHTDSNVPPPTGPNKYKMTRGKSLRSNYVDVLNPGATSKPSNSPAPAPNLFPTVNYSSPAPTNYFIPAPVEGNENAPSDFLSQSNPPVLGKNVDHSDSSQPQQQALSRWSSTSSLSREVQKYTMKSVGKTKDSSISNDNYRNQWITPPGPSGNLRNSTQTFTLPRSKAYPK